MIEIISSTQLTNDDISIPLVISYETNLEQNVNAQCFRQTLDNNNWQYVFLNISKKFNGVIDKIKGYLMFLNTLPNNKIVILSDARDVFCCRSPIGFIEGFNHLTNNDNDKILVSTEMFLLRHMNWTEEEINKKKAEDPNYFFQGIPINNYWAYHKIDTLPFRKYVNSGLISGKVSKLKELFKWILDNNYTDDQLGVSEYTNNFPNLVHLDTNAELLHTSGFGVNGGAYNIHIQKLDAPSFSELFGCSSFFLHIPGIEGIKGQKVCYNCVKKCIQDNISLSHVYGINGYPYLPNFKYEK